MPGNNNNKKPLHRSSLRKKVEIEVVSSRTPGNTIQRRITQSIRCKVPIRPGFLAAEAILQRSLFLCKNSRTLNDQCHCFFIPSFLRPPSSTTDDRRGPRASSLRTEPRRCHWFRHMRKTNESSIRFWKELKRRAPPPEASFVYENDHVPVQSPPTGSTVQELSAGAVNFNMVSLSADQFPRFRKTQPTRMTRFCMLLACFSKRTYYVGNNFQIWTSMRRPVLNRVLQEGGDY